jgi:hypothetical protein
VEYSTDSDVYRRIIEAQSKRSRELGLLQQNNHAYKLNIEAREKHVATSKKQIVDLQAQLVASQDRIAELQQALVPDCRVSAFSIVRCLRNRVQAMVRYSGFASSTARNRKSWYLTCG